MSLDVRWEQRFQNFARALVLLKEALETESPSELEQEGTIQRFEYTFELAWKTLKDYLEHSGIEITEVTARNVFKEAFAANIIKNQEIFIEMIKCRNLLSHTYDFEKFNDALFSLKNDFFAELEKLRVFFMSRLVD